MTAVRSHGWHEQAVNERVRLALWEPAESLSQKTGFVLLSSFLLLLFGRICDFYLTGMHLPLIISILCLVFAFAGGKVLTLFGTRAGILLLAFSAWLCLAVPTSFWRGGSVELLKDQWLKSLATFLLAGTLIVSARQCAQILRVLASALLIAAILALAFGTSRDGRLALLQGFYGSNELATGMVLGLVCWSFTIRNPAHSRLARILSLPCSALLLYVLVKTGSRAGLVALAIVLPFMYQRSKKSRVLGAALALAVVVGGFAFLPRITMARFRATFSDEAAQQGLDEKELEIRGMARGSAVSRWELLMTAIALTVENPVFGVGPGNFAGAENRRAVQLGKETGSWQDTHNTYLEISSEAGIPALLLFLCCMRNCWKELKAAEARYTNCTDLRSKEFVAIAFTLRAILVCYSIIFVFENLSYSPFFPALVGMTAAFSRASQHQIGSLSALPATGRIGSALVSSRDRP